jgi:hypothetical protein
MADKNGILGMVRKEAVDAGEMAEENWTWGIVRKEALDAGEMKGNVREPARPAKERRGRYPILLLFPGIWVSPNIFPNLNSNCQFYKGACNKNKCSQGCLERPLGLA